jgi:predicted esterase
MAARTTLIALHGYSLNGSQMKSRMGSLAESLAAEVDLLYPDAPHVSDAATIDRHYAAWQVPKLPPPYLSWWRATDDGRVYRGWEKSRDALVELVQRHQPAAVLGFSQGAAMASVLAALSDRGELPPLRFVVVIAGTLPRAEALTPLFERLVTVASLHVWGNRDTLVGARPAALAERFHPSSRSLEIWPGPHVIPTRGAAAERIVDFVRNQKSA